MIQVNHWSKIECKFNIPPAQRSKQKSARSAAIGTTLRATYMVCRGKRPSLFHFHGLTAAPLSPPNVSSATGRLNAFSCGYRDAVPLTGVLYQKALSRPVSVFIKTGRHVGGTGLKMRRDCAKTIRYRGHSRRGAEGRRADYRYGHGKKRAATAADLGFAPSARLFCRIRQTIVPSA
jgi:hypothetical protein